MNLRKRLQAYLLTFAMVLSLLPQTTHAADGSNTQEPQAHVHQHEFTVAAPEANAPANPNPVKAEGTTVLAFTSDVHNCFKNGTTRPNDNMSAARLGTWIDKVEAIHGDIDVMAFGGDMANASASATEFWSLTQNDLSMLAEKGVNGVLTTGNHEHSPGKYSASSTDTTQQVYKINTEAAVGDDYRIYCLGSVSSSSSYSTQYNSLDEYLKGVGNDKPIFIITHFPLHYYKGTYMNRTTTDADKVINVLNDAVDRGQIIVYLWGHNHTESDTYYDQIYGPGTSIPYSSSQSKDIKFYYGAAGCMSDSEYGDGSGFVKGKGLIVTINKNRGNATMAFTYYDADGKDVTETASVKSVDVTVRSTTTYVPATELVEGGEYLIANGNTGEVYIVSNEVTGSGDNAGLVGISATVSDGKITLSEENAAKAVFTAELKESSSGSVSAWLKNGDGYLYTASSGGLRINSTDQTGSGNTGKFWHYNATDKLLWFFKDTSSTDGYSDKSGTYKYWLDFSNDGTVITAAHTSNSGTTSISDFTTDDIYLFVKGGSGTGGDPVATETRYVEATSFVDGKDYIVAVEKGNGEVYALKNAGSGSLSSETLTVYPADDASPSYVKTTDTSLPWTYSTATRNRISNASRYLTINSSSKALETDTSGNYAITYNVNSKLELTYPNSQSGNIYYVKCTDGTFAATAANESSDATTIKLYVKTEVETDPVALEAISIDETATVEEGKTINLTVTYTPADATNTSVTWESSNTNVATVSNGTVTGVSVGTATITVKSAADESISDTCVVTVTESTAPKYVETTTLKDGREYIIAATKDNGSVYAVKNVATGTSSTNTGSVTLTVNQNGTTNYILTVDAGVPWTYTSSTQYMTNGSFYLYFYRSGMSYVPRATTNESNAQAVSYSGGKLQIGTRYLTCSSGTFGSSSSSGSDIRLFEKVVPEVPATNITLNKTTVTLEAGETETLTATLTPPEATTVVTWESSNSAVATVENGVVTAVAGGTATITAVAGSVSATCEVTVTEPEPTRYIEVSALQEGKNYIVAVTKDANHVYVINNNNGSLATAELSTTTESGKENIYTASTTVVWKYNGGDRHFMTQGSYYLNITNSGTARDLTINTTQAYGAGYTEDFLFYLQNYSATSGKKYYIAFNNGTFSSTAANTPADAATIRLFEEYDGSVYYDVTLPEGFTGVASVKEGTDYTFTKSADADDYIYGDVSYTMGGGASTPITADDNGVYTIANVTGDLVISGTRTLKPGTTYILTDSLVAGKKYVFASSNAVGSTYILGHDGDTAETYNAIIVNDSGKLTITTSKGNVAFDAAAISNGMSLTNGGYYMTVEGSGTLQFSTASSTKYWNYTENNKLSCASSSATRYLTFSNNAFAGYYQSSNPNPASIYLFVEKTEEQHEHTYGTPTYTWSEDNTTCTATAVCTGCEEGTEGHTVTETVNATFEVTKEATCTEVGIRTYTATFQNSLFEAQTKPVEIPIADHTLEHHEAAEATCTKDGNIEYWFCTVCEKYFSNAAATVEITHDETVIAHSGHAYGTPVWNWNGVASATATFTCANCNDVQTVTDNDIASAEGTDENIGHTVYTAEVEFGGQPYTDTKAVINQYTLTFKDGDEVIGTITKNFGEAIAETEIPAVPTKAFYTGTWGEVPATMPAEDMIISVQWTAYEGYYLVGINDDWTANEAYEFKANPANPSEYMLSSVNLTMGTELKAVKALGGEIKTWYPDNNGNIVVGPDHAGTVTVYFSPEYKSDWVDFGGYIYIAKDHAITVETPNSHGTATADHSTASKDTTIILSITSDTGYELDRIEFWRTNGGTVVELPLIGTSFLMPDYDVTVKVYFKAQTYTITWKNDDGTELAATTAEYGTTPVFNGETPTKAATADYRYEFSGWTPDVVAAVGDATYTAQYNQIARTYGEPTWNWTGSETEGWTADTATFTTNDGDAVFTKTAPASVTSEDTVPASCETAGTRKFTATATFNGTVYSDTKESTIPAAGHSWGSPSYAWTETADGYACTATRTCSKDANHIETETVAGVYSVVTEATETTAGIGRYTATFTNSAFATQTKDVEIPPTGYRISYVWADDNSKVTATAVPYAQGGETISEEVVPTSETKEPTCTEKGETVYTATFTNAVFTTQTKTVEIEALGHDYQDAVTAPTCTAQGYTTHTCTRCSDSYADTYVDPLGHDYHDAVTAPTCTEAGYTTHTCSRCSDSYVDSQVQALGHQPGDPTRENEVPATCTEAGSYYEVVKCTRCGEELSRTPKTIAALGHDFGEWIQTKDPTCTETGEETRTCSRCATKETRTVAALGHDLTAHPAAAATCTEAGNSAYWSCSRCEKYFSDAAGEHEIEENSWVIAATGHNWNEGVITTEPTCTKTGVKTFTCTKCGETRTEEVAALGHDLTAHPAAAATCTEAGNSAYWSCSRCGKYFSDADGEHEIEENSWVVEAAGHKWNEGVITTPATCTAKGVKTYTCTVCGATRTEEIPIDPDAHDWNEPAYTWNENHTSVTAHFVCSRSEAHTHDEEIREGISYNVTTEPSAGAPGVGTYSVTFTYEGKEYTATDQVVIPATGVTVSGNITSFVGRTEEGQVFVELFAEGSEEAAYTATVSEDNATYTFTGVASGTYTMKVSKKDHVTRSYEVTVANEAVAQDVKIHLLGDVNGDGSVDTYDVARANSHARLVSFLEGYELACADIDGDGEITTFDVARMNSHARLVSFLW